MNYGKDSALFMDNGLGYKPEVHFDVISPDEYVEAIDFVPDLVEPACGFFKNHIYKIKSIRGNFVDMLDEYGSTDTFSLTDKDNSNYFWKWFRKYKNKTLTFQLK